MIHIEAINEKAVHTRVEHIRYIYQKSHLAFETYMQPIAAYDRDGRIVRATSDFRALAGITGDDISKGSANIFDCLNGGNAGILEAVRDVFNDTEIIVPTNMHPLHFKTTVAEYQLSKFKYAVFFPMAYAEKSVRYGGVVLIE